jgi:hypothetical protein
MCSECHSTGVHKNYDAANDRFATTWSEIHVGCEACHGRGSNHVAWARGHRNGWSPGKGKAHDAALPVAFDERHDGDVDDRRRERKCTAQQPAGKPPQGSRDLWSLPRAPGTVCRDWVPGRSLTETHDIAGISPGLYQADGQMQDEVYTYGSFRQSRMYAAGVTCSRLPRSARRHAASKGEQVCAQCHAPAKYAAATHHHHEGVTPAVSCISCHMPERTYMVVDRRHDHSFRIPRPDQSARLGTSNACNDCHQGRTAQWAAAAVERWHGPVRKGFQTYAEAFHAAWTDQIEAPVAARGGGIRRSRPGVRACECPQRTGEPALAAQPGLGAPRLADPDPMVRIGAIELLGSAFGADPWPLVAPLLSDPDRGVRIRAAALLARPPSTQQPAPTRNIWRARPANSSPHSAPTTTVPKRGRRSGMFWRAAASATEAEVEYQAALRISPHYAPAAINLADLYREMGRDQDAEAVLRRGLQVNPQPGQPPSRVGTHPGSPSSVGRSAPRARARHEAGSRTGALRVRLRDRLDSAGRRGEAMRILRASLQNHPNDRMPPWPWSVSAARRGT